MGDAMAAHCQRGDKSNRERDRKLGAESSRVSNSRPEIIQCGPRNER